MAPRHGQPRRDNGVAAAGRISGRIGSRDIPVYGLTRLRVLFGEVIQ